MTDIVERLRDEAVKVSIERAGGNGVSSKDATGSVIWEASKEIESLLSRAEKAEAEHQQSSREWRDAFDAMHQRSMKAEATCEKLAKALEPFSDFSGAVFARNFNSHDDIMELDPGDGDFVALSGGDFFEARRALSEYRKEASE